MSFSIGDNIIIGITLDGKAIPLKVIPPDAVDDDCIIGVTADGYCIAIKTAPAVTLDDDCIIGVMLDGKLVPIKFVGGLWKSVSRDTITEVSGIVHMIDDTFLIITEGSVISSPEVYKTTDFGDTCEHVATLPIGYFYTSAAFPQSIVVHNETTVSYCLSTYTDMGVYRTTDTGEIWNKVDIEILPDDSSYDYEYSPRAISKNDNGKCISAGYLYVNGNIQNRYRIVYSIDNGATWDYTSYLNLSWPTFYGIYLVGDIVGLIRADGNLYFNYDVSSDKTSQSDAWESKLNLGTNHAPVCIDYETDVIYVLYAGTSTATKLYKSTDYGLSWTNIDITFESNYIEITPDIFLTSTDHARYTNGKMYFAGQVMCWDPYFSVYSWCIYDIETNVLTFYPMVLSPPEYVIDFGDGYPYNNIQWGWDTENGKILAYGYQMGLLKPYPVGLVRHPNFGNI